LFGNNQKGKGSEKQLPYNKRILITGANGFIGRTISPYLHQLGYNLRSFDRTKSASIVDSYIGDLTDFQPLLEAANDIDCIIHLAAQSDDADFITKLLPSNVVGLYHVLEAARIANVKNLIFASSCQVADLVGKKEIISVYDRFPTNHYGLTKLWAEDMAQMYANNFGIDILVVRLGWVVRSLSEIELMETLPGGKELFLSHNDLRELFRCILGSSLPTYGIVYAFSKQREPEIFDMDPSRRLLGYEPLNTFPDGLDFLSDSK